MLVDKDSHGLLQFGDRVKDTPPDTLTRKIAEEDVRFSVEIRAGSPDPLCTLGDSSGRLGLLEISIEGGEEAGQRPVTINAPELLFGDQQPGADPTFGLIAGSPSLHVAANDANHGECRLDYVGAA